MPEVGIGQAVPRSASSYWPGGGASLIKWPALGGGHQTSSDPTTSEPPPLFHQVHSALPSLFGGLEVGSSFSNNMVIFGTEKESFIQKIVLALVFVA